MKAEDCVIMIKINFLPYLPYLSRKAQFSFLTNQITKFEIVFTKNISISVGLLTDHTNCPFFFFAQEVCRGYQITHQGASVQPTLKPTATQKEQDEWELGVLKELLYWFIPVQGDLYKQLSHKN